MDIIETLRASLGPDAVLIGDDVSSRQSGIWRQDTIKAGAIIRPVTTKQVSDALAICNDAKQPVVAHGGLTGLAKSAITEPKDIVLSLERMSEIEEINVLDRTMVVQSGVILQTLQEKAEEKGLMFPLDLGARGSCTIGGNISTNAGGNRVVRYGMTRDMVLGLEAVLADGTIVSSMNQMIKNNAGYDVKQLFIGTEGSIGIVTRAVLRLRELPRNRSTFLVAVEEFEKLSLFLKFIDASLAGSLSAFEVMWNNFYPLVTTAPANNSPPLSQDHPYYVLVESIGSDDSLIESSLASAYEQNLITDAVVSKSETQRTQLWNIRDSVEECLRFKPSYTFDVSMRISKMESYVKEINAKLSEKFGSYTNFTFGHMADGNLHLVISTGKGGPDVRAAVEKCVYEPLVAIDGSVSAEHGVGLEKKPYLSLSRSSEEIDLMRRLKSSLDPNGILNPGKIFDLV